MKFSILKATLAMVVWSVAVGFGLVQAGAGEHFYRGEWTLDVVLWSLGTALALLIALMVNVWLFLKVGGEDPWRWFKK